MLKFKAVSLKISAALAAGMVAAAIGAAPAMADPGADRAATVAGEPATAPTADARKARSSKLRYCVELAPTTGSRIQRRLCKTESEWAQEGFDVHQAAN